MVPASVLHQAALALYRAGTLCQHVRRRGRACPRSAREKERQEAHPVFAAYMDMRYSRNMSRDEAREKVIPAYMGLIKQIDDQMGVLMRFLEARGLLDTTMIVFTSRSWRLSRRSLDGREGSVPRAVGENPADRDRSRRTTPMRTRGTVCDALVEAIDLAPTFIDYFGGTPPDHILEGRSLMPLLRGETPADGAGTCSPNTTIPCRTCG